MRRGPCRQPVGRHPRTLAHPTAFTLDALSTAGSSVWRTEHGAVTVTIEDGVPFVSGNAERDRVVRRRKGEIGSWRQPKVTVNVVVTPSPDYERLVSRARPPARLGLT